MSGVHTTAHRITLTREYIQNDFVEEARVLEANKKIMKLQEL